MVDGEKGLEKRRVRSFERRWEAGLGRLRGRAEIDRPNDRVTG